MVPQCENCGKPATLKWSPGGQTTCDRCRPGNGESATPLAVDVGARQLVSREEAAALLSVSVDTFDRHVRHKVKAKMVGNRPMYSVEELRAYAASGAKQL